MKASQTPLNQLGFSEHFLACARSMGFHSLQDILDCPPGQALIKEGFDYLWLEELTAYLSAEGRLTLWQPLPGNNAR